MVKLQRGSYRLYDQSKERVIYSRDVRFNKTKKADVILGTCAPTDDHADKMTINVSSDNEEPQESDAEPQTPCEPDLVRGSTRERRQPDYYGRE